MKKARDYIAARSPELADHVGKGIAAWKTGKILGSAISAYLENRYNIPRDISLKLSETAVQGLTATGLDIKHLKTPGEITRKLISELAAAFVGKMSHAGVENFLTSKEIENTISAILPTLTGKISGIGTAIATAKAPSPKAMVDTIAKRSEDDINKIKQYLKPDQLGFSEEYFPVGLVGDLTLLALYIASGRFQGKNNKIA